MNLIVKKLYILFYSFIPEPVFVNIYGAQESMPPVYVAWRAGTSNIVVVWARQAGNRFLGSLEVLQIRNFILCVIFA